VDGHAVVTDDCLVLEWQQPRLLAVPSYPSLRLWTSTADRLLGRRGGLKPMAEYTSKLRVGPGASAIGFRRSRVPLRKIYVIDRGRGPARIDPLSGHHAYIELLKMTFRLDPFDREGARRQIAALAAIVQGVPVATLRVPLRLESLRGVRQAIAADLASARPSPASSH